MSAREDIKDIFFSAIKGANPYHLLKERLFLKGDQLVFNGDPLIDLSNIEQVITIGAGKAVASMAMAIEEIFNGLLNRGIIIVKYGHTKSLGTFMQIEASHPIPDTSGLRGTEIILDVLKDTTEKTLVICLLSGGASSLLVAPASGITLDEKMKVTALLLQKGAAIEEINSVRKHISRIKGGRLAKLIYPAKLLAFVLSDVIGNRLDVIASGPTVPDKTSFSDAMYIIEKYDLCDRLPQSVLEHLEKGLKGEVEETPKGKETFFNNTKTLIIGGIENALAAAREKALSMGYETEIFTSRLQGEARDAAHFLARKSIEYDRSNRSRGRQCLLAGGETTVTVKGNGIGGRNQELALAFAIEIEGLRGFLMLSSGTDGTDGPTDAAGAIVDGETTGIAKRYGLDPVKYLEDNDSYNFFKRLDILSGNNYQFITGPTGTNVMDLQIVLLNR